MKTFKLTVSSMDGEIFSGEAVSLSLRGADGDLAVLPGRAPFITSVVECECKICTEDSKIMPVKCKGGLLCVSKDETVLTLRIE